MNLIKLNLRKMSCSICKKNVTNKNSETKCCGLLVCSDCGIKTYYCPCCKKEVARFIQDEIYHGNPSLRYLTFSEQNYQEIRYGSNPLKTAIERNNLSAVQVLSKICEKEKYISDLAIEYGNTEIIRCLNNEGFYFKSRTPLQLLDDYVFLDIREAAEIGNIL